ncbi:radical SAM family heme chaperone HemW [Glycocaulis alkaliphilus]|uniref:radical SAM family heme chaperone HemW n=1 Tax=Glycocaulis alkaliphilus TaxID=1434191 RepID=UPI000FD8462E|nr:radical SAM family heme chaperone HemW [Glycocaulis alkaliphilus]GGB79895.1 coproporphyrinogen III oxidase [Glycocaulis alkaliphilus]
MSTHAPAPLGLYIHWPYCVRICPYCDFNVYKAKGADSAALVDALIADMARWRAVTGPRTLASIHFGGGTPSLMEARDIARILETAETLWGLAPEAELGLEANPAERSCLADIVSAGINRLSVGMQSLDDAALARLGRDHDARAGLEALEIARSLVARVSADLIYAREDQSLDGWKGELSTVLALGIDHLSAYQLTIEDGTAFARQVKRGTLVPPPEDLAADMFTATQDLTRAAGLEAYEISNHARADAHRSRHNRLYWTGGDWIGIGPGAHGRIGSHAGGGRIVHAAPMRPADYIAASQQPLSELEHLSALEEAQERVLMGLRIAEGLDRTRLKSLTGHDVDEEAAASLLADGLIAMDASGVRLTTQGRLYADRVANLLAP